MIIFAKKKSNLKSMNNAKIRNTVPNSVWNSFWHKVNIHIIIGVRFPFKRQVKDSIKNEINE